MREELRLPAACLLAAPCRPDCPADFFEDDFGGAEEKAAGSRRVKANKGRNSKRGRFTMPE